MRMKHGHKGRFNYQQYGPGVVCINRTLIQQRLLVEFSCDPHVDSLLRALLACVIIGLCVQWLPQHSTCLKNIINITNMCLELGYWPSHFKTLITIVILKPNKLLYDSSKSFRPIVLLNTLDKLIEKVIGDRLQFHTISNNFIYQSQLGGLKFKFISDVGMVLTYFIHMGWVRNLSTSTLAFNISQFFLSLNHWLLTLILGKCYSTRVWTDFGLGLGLGPQVIISLQWTKGQEIST